MNPVCIWNICTHQRHDPFTSTLFFGTRDIQFVLHDLQLALSQTWSMPQGWVYRRGRKGKFFYSSLFSRDYSNIRRSHPGNPYELTSIMWWQREFYRRCSLDAWLDAIIAFLDLACQWQVIFGTETATKNLLTKHVTMVSLFWWKHFHLSHGQLAVSSKNSYRQKVFPWFGSFVKYDILTLFPSTMVDSQFIMSTRGTVLKLRDGTTLIHIHFSCCRKMR